MERNKMLLDINDSVEIEETNQPVKLYMQINKHSGYELLFQHVWMDMQSLTFFLLQQ